MAGKISNKQIEKQLASFIVKETIKQNKVKFQTQVVKAFEKIKREMILEFMNHPVTREILGGPNASNESGTLDGYGNLFSFIGFNEGEDPIEIILDLLNDSKIQYSNIADSGIMFTIFIPSKQKIFAATPLPWASGRSWSEGIERGLSGLGYYLNRQNLNNSKSGTGIQVKSNLRKGSKYKPVKYISSLMNEYTKRFQNIDKTIIISKII
jgi:hypothetical protein